MTGRFLKTRKTSMQDQELFEVTWITKEDGETHQTLLDKDRAFKVYKELSDSKICSSISASIYRDKYKHNESICDATHNHSKR